jgi:hypothetical protein
MTRFDSLGDQLQAEAEDAEDNAAALQDEQEREEQSIRDFPGESPEMFNYLFNNDKWDAMNYLIRKLISQYKYQGLERAEGLQDVSQEIYDLCQRTVSEQAAINIANRGEG